jgi:protein tyrosine phosphatase
MVVVPLQVLISDATLYGAVDQLPTEQTMEPDELVRQGEPANVGKKILEAIRTAQANGIHSRTAKKILSDLLRRELPSEELESPGLFPNETVSLPFLAISASEYQAHHDEKARFILDTIKARVKVAPEILALTKNDAKLPQFRALASQTNPPFDFNRLGKDVPGVFLDASDVQTAVQRYFLSSMPRTLKCAQDYWDEILRQGAQVVVSLHEEDETWERCYDFWKASRISQMTFRDGWELTITNIKTFAIGAFHERWGQPKIIETTYEASQGEEKRTITHLHFDGWRDKSPIPDEGLLCILIRRVEELSPEGEAPIAINCHGGIGRTGTLAVIYDLFKEWKELLAIGIPPDRIYMNIPERLYALRKQRQGLIGQPSQFAQIPSVLSKLVSQEERGMTLAQDTRTQ